MAAFGALARSENKLRCRLLTRIGDSDRYRCAVQICAFPEVSHSDIKIANNVNSFQICSLQVASLEIGVLVLGKYSIDET
jgi:hypothetical protein